MVQSPRLTLVSEGNPFRRLDERSKAGEVFDVAMFSHDVLHKLQRALIKETSGRVNE